MYSPRQLVCRAHYIYIFRTRLRFPRRALPVTACPQLSKAGYDQVGSLLTRFPSRFCPRGPSVDRFANPTRSCSGRADRFATATHLDRVFSTMGGPRCPAGPARQQFTPLSSPLGLRQGKDDMSLSWLAWRGEKNSGEKKRGEKKRGEKNFGLDGHPPTPDDSWKFSDDV